MIHPSYTDLMQVVNSEVEPGEAPLVTSRYSIVMATSKRARQIVDGSDMLIDTDDIKPVSIATTEVFEKKVTYKVTFFEDFDLNFEENEK